jgi:peptidoglycan/xylan/chitin deacetylase (PgdA/CDA1 family)
LALWLGDGHELGNHTFSHPDLNRTSVREFEADVAAARHVIDPLVTALGGSVRYFRYPQLHTGDDQRVKRDVADYLSGLGYVNAPVTIDSQEWVFAAAYDRALAAGDSAAARCVADAYLPFMERVVAFFEQRAREVVGREPSQVLLIHANLLNAETFDGLAGMFEARGYAFVTLEEALRDPAYGRADTYVGPRGLSWIHRWAADVGLEPREEPREPSWIAELSQAPPGRRWVCPNT